MTATSLPKPPLNAWIAVASAWVISLCALLAWLLWTPWFALRAQLTLLQFWSLEICAALGLVVSPLVLWDCVRRLSRRDLLQVTLPLALALGLTLGVAPRTNRIYYDEQIYQNIGQNLADLRRAQLCNDGAIVGGRLQCSSAEYNKQPYAYPHALSVVFRIFGVGPRAAFAERLATGFRCASSPACDGAVYDCGSVLWRLPLR